MGYTLGRHAAARDYTYHCHCQKEAPAIYLWSGDKLCGSWIDEYDCKFDNYIDKSWYLIDSFHVNRETKVV